jgi:dimethylglycine dehydrogenase
MNVEMTAFESGLDRFVKLDKGDFSGRQALAAQRDAGLKQRLTTIAITTDDASVLAHEGVYREGVLIGRISSGGYSYHLGHDVAFALLPEALWTVGTELEVLVLGERRKARVIAESPYDPANQRCRM